MIKLSASKVNSFMTSREIAREYGAENNCRCLQENYFAKVQHFRVAEILGILIIFSVYKSQIKNRVYKCLVMLTNTAIYASNRTFLIM